VKDAGGYCGQQPKTKMRLWHVEKPANAIMPVCEGCMKKDAYKISKTKICQTTKTTFRFFVTSDKQLRSGKRRCSRFVFFLYIFQGKNWKLIDIPSNFPSAVFTQFSVPPNKALARNATGSNKCVWCRSCFATFRRCIAICHWAVNANNEVSLLLLTWISFSLSSNNG